MRIILQRVTNAKVDVDNKTVGEIRNGLLLLVGIGQEDTMDEVELLADKICNLRIFTDENDKMNLSLLDINGEILAISNFTLYADCRKGRRPNFTKAGAPTIAEQLYDKFCEILKQKGIDKVEKGIFGADMKVSLLNDGPITIQLDSDEFKKPRR